MYLKHGKKKLTDRVRRQSTIGAPGAAWHGTARHDLSLAQWRAAVLDARQSPQRKLVLRQWRGS